jgi:DNA-binding response OmpR family regulator
MNESISHDKPTLFLVEDEEDTANLVKLIMEEQGYQVVRDADGREAQEMIVLMPPPSLTLLDIQLPHVDGVNVLRTIRATPDWQNASVVMLTADANEQDVHLALALGAKDYILKPFKRDMLGARLQRYSNSSVPKRSS